MYCGTYFHRFLSSNDGIPSDKCTSYLLSELNALKSQQLSAVQRVLNTALKSVRPTVCPVINKIRKAYAVVLEPARMSDNPIKFTAGLTVAVQFIAEIENVENTENLRIQVGVFCIWSYRNDPKFLHKQVWLPFSLHLFDTVGQTFLFKFKDNLLAIRKVFDTYAF